MHSRSLMVPVGPSTPRSSTETFVVSHGRPAVLATHQHPGGRAGGVNGQASDEQIGRCHSMIE